MTTFMYKYDQCYLKNSQHIGLTNALPVSRWEWSKIKKKGLTNSTLLIERNGEVRPLHVAFYVRYLPGSSRPLAAV